MPGEPFAQILSEVRAFAATADDLAALQNFIAGIIPARLPYYHWTGFYMLDPDGYVSSWNPGARRFKGYEESEILGEHFSRFYTEADRKTGLPRRALETAAREGKFEGEGWRCRKDGTRFWAFVVIDPIKDASGNLIGFAKITRDLTERKLAEEALRKSEEQFRLLVQGVTVYAIYMLTPDGKVSSWNPGAERIKG